MKYILFDTDFISKAHISQKDTDHHLIDLVMEFEGCEFYCHEQIVRELSRHNIGNSPQWLDERIAAGKIKLLSDKDIVGRLRSVYSGGAYSMFCKFLKKSCETFDPEYYKQYFLDLEEMKDPISDEEFLTKLAECDSQIGFGESLGEKKTCVLLQTLQLINPNEVYIFCSDDRAARKNIIAIGNVKCISVLSLFWELKNRGFSKMDVEPYFNSYVDFCKRCGQTECGVWEFGEIPRMKKVPFDQLLEDIFDDKFVQLGTGYLKYKE